MMMVERNLFVFFSAVVVLALVAASCGGERSSEQEIAVSAGPQEIHLEAVASGLDTPWAMAFAPDGRLFLTERPGRIRVVDGGGLEPEPWAEVDVVSPEYRSEGGLLGIAVAPDFETTGHVFVVGTFLSDGRLMNRVLRFTDRNGRGEERTVVIDGVVETAAESGTEAALHTHLGGALAFGPDGMLYLTTGDTARPELSQQPDSLAGKILRYRPDGSVPPDNPTPGSPVYALGIRNSQGVAWDPETGDLFAIDHGPSELSWETNYGGWFGDELDAIIPGGNYGWPRAVGMDSPGPYIDPLVEWSPSIAPAGVAVYSGSDFPWQGDILVTSLRGQRLWRITLQRDETLPTGWKAAGKEGLIEGLIGRIRAIAMGRDGYLYIGSSNRDSRGKPQPEDDRIYRVRP